MFIGDKKSFILGVIFVFSILLFFMQFVSASIGVRPASYELDFKPNFEQVYDFQFFQDGDGELEVYSEGDLAEYVTLSTNKLIGEGIVYANLKLPDKLDVPGTHRLYIGAKQVVGENKGFSLVGNIQGLIKVNVPYPGQYLEIIFGVTNANAGQNISFNLRLNNLGKEIVIANSRIEIYDIYGKELIKIIPMDSKILESTEMVDLQASLETTNYNPGDYKAIAFIDYGDGKSVKSEGIFRLGEMRAEVVNYTSIFKKGLINRMEIDIESFWNDPLENLYATVSVQNTSIYFQTPSITLKGFEKSRLTGFLDTSEIEKEPFSANITLHYNGKTTERIVTGLRFEKENNNSLFLIILVASALVIVAVILFLIWRKRKNATKSRKK